MQNINNHLEDFIQTLFLYLTKNVVSKSNNCLIRKHSIKLEEKGEVSFPIDINCWQKYIDIKNIKEGIAIHSILEYNSEIQPFDAEKLKQISIDACWPLLISNCFIEQHCVYVHIERFSTFTNVLNCILHLKASYGSNNKGFQQRIVVTHELFENTFDFLNLSQLRVILLHKVVKKLLKFMKYEVLDRTENNFKTIHLSTKITENQQSSCICGNVKTIKNSVRNNTITANEFYRKRSMDMRLMAQHKYGLRINSEPGWESFFKRLGEASVTIDLLSSKPMKNITLNFDNPVAANNKGASFVLYNCARLAALFKKHETQVAENVYPPLPPIGDIDFKLLSQPEEWELLYIYLLQFPTVVNNSIEDIGELKINPQYICSFLNGLCSLFSLYYRRVRILTESRSHMIPVLHARIYFLKAIEIVLHNGLWLLDIAPITQM